MAEAAYLAHPDFGGAIPVGSRSPRQHVSTDPPQRGRRERRASSVIPLRGARTARATHTNALLLLTMTMMLGILMI
jgi:hypothetical protein